MGRVLLLLLFVTVVISRDIFEPTDLDNIFNSEGRDGALENTDDQHKAKPSNKNTSKDNQHIGFQYSNESTTTCFINPQTSEAKVQKAQLSYIISLSSLLSKVSAAPSSSSVLTQTSSASVSKESSSVFSSKKPASVLARTDSAKRVTSASTYRSEEQSEEPKSSSYSSSVLTSIPSKDEKKAVTEDVAAVGKHKKEASVDSKKGKHGEAEPAKGQYWTTVMAYGSPEKVLIGVKTITIIESIIREPVISGAATYIAKSIIGEKAMHSRHETMKVGDMVKTSRNISDLEQQSMEATMKNASTISTIPPRPELAADMPIHVKKDKSITTSREEKTHKMASESAALSSISTKHYRDFSASNVLEILTTVPPVHKGVGHEDSTSRVSKPSVSTSYTTKISQHKKHEESTDMDTKSVHTTDQNKKEKTSASATSKSLVNLSSSTPASSSISDKAKSSSFNAALSKKDASSITTMSSVPKSVSSVMLSSAISKLNISSVRHKLSQVNEKILRSFSGIESRQISATTSFVSITSKKTEEKESEKVARSSKDISSARSSESISGHASSKQLSEIGPHTSKSTSTKKKSSSLSPSTAYSTSTKKHKEGFGGLGIWKRIGDFSNDDDESSKDVAEKNGHVSSSAIKSVSVSKESSGDRSRKNDSIVDILTVLNGISKKKGDNAKVFVDGDFQAKQNDKRIGNKFKFKGWVSSNSNE